MNAILAFVTYQNDFLESPSTREQNFSAVPKIPASYLLKRFNWNQSRVDGRNILLKTTFGVELELDHTAGRVLRIASRTRAAGATKIKETASAESKKPGSEYWLFPEWGTSSYLWSREEDSEVREPLELEEIQDRYPAIYKEYHRWQVILESIMNTCWENCDFHSEMMDKTEEVAWEICGFLMAFWFVSQPDVHSVECDLHRIRYDICKENLESEFEKFLHDQNRRLEVQTCTESSLTC